MRINFTTAAITAALTLGASGLAFAQTGTVPRTTGPNNVPASGGGIYGGASTGMQSPGTGASPGAMQQPPSAVGAGPQGQAPLYSQSPGAARPGSGPASGGGIYGGASTGMQSPGTGAAPGAMQQPPSATAGGPQGQAPLYSQSPGTTRGGSGPASGGGIYGGASTGKESPGTGARPGAMEQPPRAAAGSTPGHSMGSQTMGGQSMDSHSGSGAMQRSASMDENELRGLLTNQGYSDVQGVSRDGNNFRARAMRNGRTVDLNIDAYTGTIRNQSARR